MKFKIYVGLAGFLATCFLSVLYANYVFVQNGKFPVTNNSGRQVQAQLIDVSNPSALEAISNEITLQKDQNGTIVVPSKNMQFPGTYALNISFPGTSFKTKINLSLNAVGDTITIPSMEAEIAAAPSKTMNGKFFVKNNSGRAIKAQLAAVNPYGKELSKQFSLDAGKQMEFTAPIVPDFYLLRIASGPYFNDVIINVDKVGQIISTPLISDADMREAQALRD